MSDSEKIWSGRYRQMIPAEWDGLELEWNGREWVAPEGALKPRRRQRSN